ncbi:virginiamycin b lyase [Anaeramoeba ignava]|uniref:Virginiamycin b lyase n=1 Tax=Anaeramoeba ignava TaxID=1746090 RepID=A0A9Q0R4J3_ANAIG|nr:virginiamycin b lyase [Anaeramoeba ignava]|eukprot:Anaeramoba_ignava/a348222_58.p1 GENE.a348222_58~~a348222_58.p1  ORF type:complete len:295 (+),score=50.26 a348222_58:39-923(+)
MSWLFIFSSFFLLFLTSNTLHNSILLGLSYDLDSQNQSIIQIDLKTNEMKEIATFPEAIYALAEYSDMKKSQQTYLVAMDTWYFKNYDAYNGSCTSKFSIDYPSFMNTVFSINDNKAYCIVSDNTNFHIASVDPVSQKMSILMTLDSSLGVILNIKAFNTKTNDYYSLVDNGKPNSSLLIAHISSQTYDIIDLDIDVDGIIYSPQNDVLYGNNGDSIFTIDPNSGRSSLLINGLIGIPEMDSIALDPSNLIVYLARQDFEQVFVFGYDLKTKNQVFKMEIPFSFRFLSFFQGNN